MFGHVGAAVGIVHSRFDDDGCVLQQHDNVLLKTVAVAGEAVNTAILIVVVSLDNVSVAKAGVAIRRFADTSHDAVDAFFAPSL